MKLRRALQLATPLVSSFVLIGCGGGSSDTSLSPTPVLDTPTINEPVQEQPGAEPGNGSGLPSVAQSRLRPLEIVTISVPSARSGSQHTVRFSSNTGFDVTYDVQARRDGEVFLSTPFVFDNPGSPIDLSISVDGQVATSLITVEPLPEVDGIPGALTLVLLERIATSYDDVSFYLEELPFTNPGFQSTTRIDQASLEAENKVDDVADVYLAIESGAESVELFPGTRISLDEPLLRQMDQWILAMAMAVTSESQSNSLPSEIRLSGRARLTEQQAERQVREMMDAVRGIENLPDTATRAGKEAAELFFEVFGTAFGVISLAPQVIVAESTATLSGVAGIAMTYLSTLSDFALTTMHSAMSKGVREGNRLSFETAKSLKEKMDDFVLAYCGARTGSLGKACTVIGLLKEKLDVSDDLIMAACPAGFNSVVNSVSEFCQLSSPAPEQPVPPDDIPSEPAPSPGLSQVLPTRSLCPAQLGNRNGSPLTLDDFSRTSTSSHHCRYKWANSGDISTPVIIFYTTEADPTSRPRTVVFCTSNDSSADTVLAADLSTNAFARTRVGSNLRQVQIEAQAQFFSVPELTSILRAAVDQGIGNSC